VLEMALKLYLVAALLFIFPLGIFLGYAYQETGKNLICPVSLHAVNNIFGLFLMAYSTYVLSLATIEYENLILIGLVRAGITGLVLWGLLRRVGKSRNKI
jgi:hypothetical protein